MTTTIIPETWRPVVDFPNYSVSDLGNVLSHQRVVYRSDGTKRVVSAKVLKPSCTRDGYLKVCLCNEKGGRTVYVHHLVTRAFLGEKKPGEEVRHLDDVKTNVTLSNLSYGSRSQNMLDAVRNGKHAWASRTHCLHGHRYTSDNTVRYSRNPRTRICRTCHRISNRRSRRRGLTRADSPEGAKSTAERCFATK